MNVLLASTSTLFGGKYLEYIKQEISELFSGIEEIIFVPFAKPGGISHDDYTEIARDFFKDDGDMSELFVETKQRRNEEHDLLSKRSKQTKAKKDRLRSSNDYKTDLKSELILEELHSEMKKILANQNKILKYLSEDEEK